MKSCLDFGFKRVIRQNIFAPNEFIYIDILSRRENHLFGIQLFTGHINIFEGNVLRIRLFIVKNEPILGKPNLPASIIWHYVPNYKKSLLFAWIHWEEGSPIVYQIMNLSGKTKTSLQASNDVVPRFNSEGTCQKEMRG